LVYTTDLAVPEPGQRGLSFMKDESTRSKGNESKKFKEKGPPTLGRWKRKTGRNRTGIKSFTYEALGFCFWATILGLVWWRLKLEKTHLMLVNESGWPYKNIDSIREENQRFFSSPSLTPTEICLKDSPNEMPSRSAPASPAPPRYTPRAFARNSGRGMAGLGTPLVSPLIPLPAGILDRTRKGSFGPEDSHPREGNVFNRVRTLSDQLWVKHRRGEELAVRPGSVVSPQTIYTGRERRANGQETYHAVLMNTRLLIHNPVTGEPGAINGHASVQLHAAPSNKCDWNLEVPYVSDLQIQNELTKYGTGVHKEVSRQRRRGQYKLTVARRVVQVESSDDESVASEGWRPSLPFAATFPASLSGPETSRMVPPASGYVTHPTGLLPPFDTSNMREVGRTLSGDHVLRFPEPAADGISVDSVAARPGTPRLPWQLLYEPPALRLEGSSALARVSDDEPGNVNNNLTDDWLPADPATWAFPGSVGQVVD
jgi:hypothetical protein